MAKKKRLRIALTEEESERLRDLVRDGSVKPESTLRWLYPALIVFAIAVALALWGFVFR
ncbi:MAG TPA: hypothetical protein VLB27_07570 [candidate division Zixibacteria bacterium]|nr:hypothetical protein [candidate division Zixibacteria bacterium]